MVGVRLRVGDGLRVSVGVSEDVGAGPEVEVAPCVVGVIVAVGADVAALVVWTVGVEVGPAVTTGPLPSNFKRAITVNGL